MSEPGTSPGSGPSSPSAVSELRAAVLQRYDRDHRPLPWRGERDPYKVLVSEVMLQQTRVETVRGRYEAWLRRFPDLDALAGAELDDVLEEWEGLGYYRRARNLHRTARVVRERWDGRIPSTAEALAELPGVGAYTSGAVASIAFGEAVPAVDGNVRRVLARLHDEPRPSSAWLHDRAAELLDPERPGDWNQAMMELGATVCTPRSPGCAGCPAARWCRARERSTQLERPEPARRRAPRRVRWALAVAEVGGRVLLLRRPDDGLLGGMWAFPEREVGSDAEAHEAATVLAGGLGLELVGEATALEPVEHRFTHLDGRYLPWRVPVRRALDVEDGAWIDPTRPDGLGVPVAQRKVIAALSGAATPPR